MHGLPNHIKYAGVEYNSTNKALWAMFLDLLGVEYEPHPYQFIDFKVKCYGKRGDWDRKPFDLYIAVCGMDGLEKNDIVKMFCLYGDSAKEKYAKWKNGDSSVHTEQYWDWDLNDIVPDEIPFPTLVVGTIPYPKDGYTIDELCGSDDDCGRKLIVYRYNYETIDGDTFGAWPCAHNGKFYLLGENDDYMIGAHRSIEAFKKISQCTLWNYVDNPRILPIE